MELLSPPRGWSGGAKVLSKLSVPWRSTTLGNSRTRAYRACSRCGCGLFGHFFYRLFLPHRETARYRLKYCLKGPLNSKQPTNRILPLHVNGAHSRSCDCSGQDGTDCLSPKFVGSICSMDIWRFCVIFNSITISGRWTDDNERVCQWKPV